MITGGGQKSCPTFQSSILPSLAVSTTDQTRGTYLDDSMPHTEHVKDGNYLFENTMLAPLEGLQTCVADGILITLVLYE